MNLKELIRTEQTKTIEVLEDAQRLQAEAAKRRQEVKDLEEAKFREFTLLATQHKYFRQAHIDSLKIPYHICIHLSAKGSGKTTEIYRMMEACIKKKEKFIYGRVYLKELRTELIEFLTDKRSPVIPIDYKEVPFLFDAKAVNR